jgi:hypothetical protein
MDTALNSSSTTFDNISFLYPGIEMILPQNHSACLILSWLRLCRAGSIRGSNSLQNFFERLESPAVLGGPQPPGQSVAGF